MRVQTFAEIVSGRAISQTRVEAALASVDVTSLRRCGISIRQLAEMVVDSIPDALDIRIDERISRRWLEAQKVAGPWPALLVLGTTAGLELGGNDRELIDLRLDFAVTLRQQDALIEVAGDGKTLTVGCGRVWRAEWLLAVRPIDTSTAAPFASGRCDVHLAANCIALLDAPKQGTSREVAASP